MMTIVLSSAVIWLAIRVYALRRRLDEIELRLYRGERNLDRIETHVVMARRDAAEAALNSNVVRVIRDRRS